MPGHSGSSSQLVTVRWATGFTGRLANQQLIAYGSPQPQPIEMKDPRIFSTNGLKEIAARMEELAQKFRFIAHTTGDTVVACKDDLDQLMEFATKSYPHA